MTRRAPTKRKRKTQELTRLALLVFLAGCADTSDFIDTTDASKAENTASGPCNEGETRCTLDSAYEKCVGGEFEQLTVCGEDQICVDAHGCVECDPQLGKGCRDNAIHACDDRGRLGAKIEPCLGLSCEAGSCINPRCAPGAKKLVYVVDSDNQLLSFDPTKESNHFTLIARLDCPAGVPLDDPMGYFSTPFSMSVDRGARAWVLYTSGELFWVDTETGDCTAAPFEVGQHDLMLFGMGFVADEPGSDKERLYVAGAMHFPETADRLGTIDPATLRISPVGMLETPISGSSAELSGTGDAELFAFFPGDTSYVAKVDKTSGKLLQKWEVPPVSGVNAWAFAHWGGSFYIFVTYQPTLGFEERKVLFLDPAAEKGSVFIEAMPYRIVGAGVSTCAPVVK